MSLIHLRLRALVLVLLLAPALPTTAIAQRKTENLVLVTLDGLRWQEVLSGADAKLLDKSEGVGDPAAARQRYWRETATERREVLMPFLWRTIVARGQLFGDAEAGSTAKLTNGFKFSYPGYQELLAGFPDPRIDSNAKRPNPNITVLEWLEQREPWHGHVAAFCCWDVFPFILDQPRSLLPVNAAWQPITTGEPESVRLLNELSASLPHCWEGERYDAITVQAAMQYARAAQPRVLYVSLGETDDWAHERRYDLYLQMAHEGDRLVQSLWQLLQSLPRYRDKTALLITTDHGRGEGRAWTDHGKDVAGAERIWIAVMGPDTPARGIRTNADVTQSQVAASVTALLGEDYASSDKRIAPPLPGILASDTRGAK